MDVYHQVLAKLYEVTGGKDSKNVDFKDLVRNLGFYGNYTDIFERLSREGWITEDKKANFVRITHWGVSEVKNSRGSEKIPDSNLKSDTNKALAEVRELGLLLEVFKGNSSKNNLVAVEKKLQSVQNLINEINSNLD